MPLDASAQAWNQRIIDNFRENAGNVTIPPFVGSNLLLLTTTGAKSGKPRISPLGFTRDGDRYVIVGSNSGGPVHPAWLANVEANPIVIIEVGAETFEAKATVTIGAERRRAWDRHVTAIPIFANYEKMTDRELPVITLERLPAA